MIKYHGLLARVFHRSCFITAGRNKKRPPCRVVFSFGKYVNFFKKLVVRIWYQNGIDYMNNAITGLDIGYGNTRACGTGPVRYFEAPRYT